MSTFIINLNDTIAMSDSTVVELAKVLGPCQACSQRVENSFNDVYMRKRDRGNHHCLLGIYVF